MTQTSSAVPSVTPSAPACQPPRRSSAPRAPNAAGAAGAPALPGIGSVAGRPSAAGSCEITIRIATPFMNPASTGCGT
jgi:hypothetical protein